MTVKDLAWAMYKPHHKKTELIIHIRTHEGNDTLFLESNDVWLSDIDRALLSSEVVFFEPLGKGRLRIIASYKV